VAWDYSQLQAELQDWLVKPELLTKIPTFIMLAESEMNLLLKDVFDECRVTGVSIGGVMPLPEDFSELIALHINGVTEIRAEQRPSGESFDHNLTYQILDSQIILSQKGECNITLLYSANIPELSTTRSTNWLLRRYPNAYLYGALHHAEAYLFNDNRSDLWKSKFYEAVATLKSDGMDRRFGRGALFMGRKK
jgi:hypothetical protein